MLKPVLSPAPGAGLPKVGVARVGVPNWKWAPPQLPDQLTLFCSKKLLLVVVKGRTHPDLLGQELPAGQADANQNRQRSGSHKKTLPAGPFAPSPRALYRFSAENVNWLRTRPRVCIGPSLSHPPYGPPPSASSAFPL